MTVSHYDMLKIPRGTRLETVYRVIEPNGRIRWQVWTACNDTSLPIERLRGTFIELTPEGEATRITVGNETDNVMTIMKER